MEPAPEQIAYTFYDVILDVGQDISGEFFYFQTAGRKFWIKDPSEFVVDERVKITIIKEPEPDALPR